MKKIILSIFTFLILQIVNAQCNEMVHSNQTTDNWLSCETNTNPNAARGSGHWIEYDLGYVYPITSTHIWNYNVSNQTDMGFKDVVIDYSLDGENWIQLGFYTFEEASGSMLYQGFEGPNFNDLNMRYILITALNNYGNSNCFGLAEMKFNVGEDVIIAIQEQSSSIALEIYPNPTSKVLFLDYKKEEIEEIIVRNVAGFEMQRYQSNLPNKIAVNDYAAGIYFIIAKTKNNIYFIKKFVKTNDN